MRPAPALLFLAVVTCLTIPLPAQVKTLQVKDISAPDSPIRISGSLLVAQSVEASPRCRSINSQRCAATSTQYEVRLRNASDKSIVAFIVEMGSSSEDGNFYPGGTMLSEKLFGPLLGAGGSEPLHVPGGTGITSLGPDGQPFPPATEARVVFAQFADGSTFGGQKAGEHLLLTRQQSLESLARLEAIYAGQGEKAFDRAARQPGAGGMVDVAYFEEQEGPAATIARIHRMLQTAKERLAAMTAQPER